MALNAFVNTLIENIPDNNLPKEIDLVLDSGAFNGIYMLGGLFYLKELEVRGKVKIKRISGCSIGSTLGILYLFNKMDVALSVCNVCYKCIRKNQDLKKLLVIIKKVLGDVITDDNVKYANKRFYLTFFDTKSGKQIVKKKYKNSEDLIDCVLKSLYVPYLIDREYTDKDGCIDGAFPYMFKSRTDENRKILFFNLQSLDKIKKMIFLKKEKNIYPRLLEGLHDTHSFFEKNVANNMCSYVNDWSIKEILFFRLREFIYVIIIYIFRIGLYIDTIFPNRWKNDVFIQQHMAVFKNVWRDIMLYLTV